MWKTWIGSSQLLKIGLMIRGLLYAKKDHERLLEVFGL
jgi:hypothetical protein